MRDERQLKSPPRSPPSRTLGNRLNITLHNRCTLTSPHPLADVTRLSARLIDPPPFPFWVERLPDSIAVSVEVRGA